MPTTHEPPIIPTTAPSTGPVAPGERLPVLDVLRGFAILGMVLVHFAQFNPNRASGGAIGALINEVLKELVRGKAHAIFAILFGVGFAIQLQRADSRGEDGRWRFGRRLLGVALFGLLTAALSGFSDIIRYAESGVWLLFVRRWSTRGLLVALLASAMLYEVWSAAVGGYQWATMGAARANELYQSPPPPPSEARRALDAEWAAADQGTSFLRLARVQLAWTVHSYRENFWGDWQRSRGNPGRILGSLMDITLLQLLVGFLALRLGIFDRPGEHRRLLGVVMCVGAAWWAVYQLKVVPTLWPAAWEIPSVRVAAAVTSGFGLFRPRFLGLAVAYIAGITLLLSASSAWERRLTALFGAAGRMALTNYLLQFVAVDIVFGNYAFGAKTVTPQIGIAAALVVFGMLQLLSRWWLTRFRFGPAEWVLRSMTYAQVQPFLRSGAPTV